MKQGYLIKSITEVKLIFAILIAIALNGCTFVVKDDYSIKYYGIDEQHGSEYLKQILEMQQQVYQSRKASVEAKKP